MEEGLHQALLIKFSHEQIDIQELRKLLPTKLGSQGRCLVRWLALQHILLRFDMYDDYVLGVAKSVNYLLHNGTQHQFGVFPWRVGLNPR